MVEDSIRRILPTVMNEVLLKTIASSGVMSEARQPVQTRLAPIQQRTKAKVAPVQQRRPQRPSSLNEMLDPEAGAEFYADPRAAMREATASEPEVDDYDEPVRPVLESRLQNLPPALRGLAEDVEFDGGVGEMWGDDEHDAATAAPMVNEIRSIDRAADSLGIDFSRMSKVVAKTTPKPIREDASAKAQFEESRLARQRERLDRSAGG